MAQWKKIIVSGSAAELASVYATGPITGSAAKFANLSGSAASGTSKIVAIAELDGSLKKRPIDVRVFDGGLLGSFGASAGQVAVYLDAENVYGDNQFTWNPTTNVLSISGSTFGKSVTIGEDLTVQGNLTINGTTTVIDTTNLAIEDKFIAIGTGTTSGTDGGIIVTSGSFSGNTVGYAFAFDAGTGRWGLRKNTALNAVAVAPDSWMVTATWGASAPNTVPVYGGTSAGIGNMHVDTATGDIYVFVETGQNADPGGNAGDGLQQLEP
jgi:hypothetical protein